MIPLNNVPHDIDRLKRVIIKGNTDFGWFTGKPKPVARWDTGDLTIALTDDKTI
jgi:hypothetical protein